MRKFCLADKTVNSFVIAVYMPMMCWRNGVLVNWKNDDLFSDAKFRKDVLKDFVGDDGAAGGDGTESVDDLADLFAQQVGGKPVAQAVESPVESLAGRREGFVMAAVRNDRIAVVECVGIDCPAQGFAQPVEARALFRRDADDVFRLRGMRG